MHLDKDRVMPMIRSALKEDLGKGDITTDALIDKREISRAVITVNEECCVCGLEPAEWLLAQVDYGARFKPNCSDGAFVGAGKEIAFCEGRAASILKAERTMLNFLSILSGIATRTRKFVEKARPYGVKIMDTRKTLPLLRYLEKYAVAVGGGSNHRMGLYDRILIKDNHIKAQERSLPEGRAKPPRRGSEKISLKNLVETARKRSAKGTVIEIEVTSRAEFEDAVMGRPDIIMLDNMSPADVRACVEMRRFSRIKPLLEVSGGIALDNVEEYAKTKVDMISIGSLTSSVESIDMSLDMV